MAELSIAIADDNRQTLNLLGEILEKEDGIHVVGKADNGEDAYNMIVRTNPDIVLMDVIMPRLDGISVMEKIKNNTQMKNHPSFIMVTAASSQDVTEDAFRLGANYYIINFIDITPRFLPVFAEKFSFEYLRKSHKIPLFSNKLVTDYIRSLTLACTAA